MNGAKGIILDLRNNPGGDYEQVVRIADMIVPEGIVYTEDRNGKREEKIRRKRTEYTYDSSYK